MALSRRHAELLDALYCVASPPSGVAHVRFELERDRRLMDVSMELGRSFPRTHFVARAWHGDDVDDGVFEALGSVRHTAPTVADAVAEALWGWVAGRPEGRLPTICAYEMASQGRSLGTRLAASHEVAGLGLPEHVRLLEASVDLPLLLRSVDFYRQRSAPRRLVQTIEAVERRCVMGFYRRGRRLKAAELTELLG